MKEMTLQEVQAVLLDILKDVCDFCESHKIRYSLAYGTLLGAIRHKGFIPWDDDVDILIPRPDFERFCKEYTSSKGYKLYKPRDSNNFLLYAHVCENSKTIAKCGHPWSNEETGIWIDILPLDGLPSDKKEFLELVKKIRNVQKKVYRLRTGKYLKLWNTHNIKDFCFGIIKRILYSRYNIEELLLQHENLLRGNDYEASEYFGQLCVMDYPEKEHNPRNDFASLIKKRFCDTDFFVFNGYDNILSRYYGNYMELPPVNKRVAQYDQKYYWKN